MSSYGDTNTVSPRSRVDGSGSSTTTSYTQKLPPPRTPVIPREAAELAIKISMDHDRESKQRARQELVQSIIDHGNKAFNPESSPASQAEGRESFDDLIQRTGTLVLMSALNLLIRPNHAPPWLRSRLMEILSTLPLRPDGVRGTLEFVFAVHPSSTVRPSDAAATQKQGASITHEALYMATSLLSAPPSSVSPETWLSGISPQLLRLLDGEDGPDLTKVAAYVIGFGILGRKDLGAPGSPGWKWLAEPMLSQLNPSIGTASVDSNDAGMDSDDIIDLSKDRVLVSSANLAKAIQRLRSLIASHPNPGLCKRLLRPMLLPLWALSSWPDAEKNAREKICLPAKELLEVYLKLASSPDTFEKIIRNITYTGGETTANLSWIYKPAADGGLRIVATRDTPSGSGRTQQASLEDVDVKISALLDLLDTVASDIDISSVFLDLFKRWLNAGRRVETEGILIRETVDSEDLDPMKQLTEVRLLQRMMERFPSKLVSRSDHALELVSQVLSNSGIAAEDDESVPVALSILNLVITAPNFRKAKVDAEVLHSLESALDRLTTGDDSDVTGTARNLSLLLRYRDEAEELSGSASGPSARQIEDRKTYNLAISYITQADSPPPVRAEGLNLIAALVHAGSPILDIPAILVLMSSLLSDGEDYINLRVIKIFTQLADSHPKSVSRELVDHFVDAKEMAPVDTRLRFGEALAQVIERLGETFTGDMAQQAGEALLATAGRRGHRPKTEAKQAKEERRQRMKHREAEDVWEGEVPDLSEDITDEEKARKEILAKIVEGWESKQGAEDIRIRASAFSIFAIAMEANIGGLGSTLASSAVDLCVNVLTMEPEAEKGILRRAAILLILSFVKALDQARQTGRRLGFGLTTESREDILRVLNYVADTDSDGLVRQHSRDVVESLQNWEMVTLLPENQTQGPSLSRLAGLSVNPENSRDPGIGTGPRIEEIE